MRGVGFTVLKFAGKGLWSDLKAASVVGRRSHVVFSCDDTWKPDPTPTLLVEASMSCLTTSPASFNYIHGSHRIQNELVHSAMSQEEAFQRILAAMISDPEFKAVSNTNSITHVCHRIVHGGDLPTAHAIDQ